MYELIEVPADRILSRLLLKELVKDPRLAAAGRAVHDDEGRLLVTRHVHALCHVVPVHLLVVRGVELDRICTGRRLSLVLHVDDDELLPRFVGIGRRGGVRERRLRVEQARQLVLMPRHGHPQGERDTVMEAQAFWARSLQRGRLRKLTFSAKLECQRACYGALLRPRVPVASSSGRRSTRRRQLHPHAPPRAAPPHHTNYSTEAKRIIPLATMRTLSSTARTPTWSQTCLMRCTAHVASAAFSTILRLRSGRSGNAPRRLRVSAPRRQQSGAVRWRPA